MVREGGRVPYSLTQDLGEYAGMPMRLTEADSEGATRPEWRKAPSPSEERVASTAEEGRYGGCRGGGLLRR